MVNSNVLSVIDAMKLCNEGKAKLFSFVSSASTLDTKYYYNLSRDQVAVGRGAVLESDDTETNRQGGWALVMGKPSGFLSSWLARLASVASVAPSSELGTFSAATMVCPIRMIS
uniref:Thioester reductase (TE) domain-containing protein n=1 Tax=Bionectria ochroleuca TaxID=29856 RepID=A0A8H7NP14_BIOOC